MKVANLVRNTISLFARQAWLRSVIDPRRDIDLECGYPGDILIDDLVRAFQRGDIAQRVVQLYPDECWTGDPTVLETEDEIDTEFELAWHELNVRRQCFSYLHRVDILSGIGRFGVLLIGIDDGKPLDQPVDGMDDRGNRVGDGRKHELLYLRAFDEGLATISELETSSSNPRFGHPKKYQLRFVDARTGGLGGISASSKLITTQDVHWHRVLHVADNRTNSDVFGNPRLEVVFNRLLDLKKVAGGSAEMFWKGGFPGISVEAPTNVDEIVEFDAEATKEQLEAYMNGLQRYLALVGMQAKSLAPNVADPSKHVETQIRLIAMALGVPWRVFMGVEIGQLASDEDTRNWNKRLERRRNKYITPFLIRPFIERLSALSILPEIDRPPMVQWPDLNTLSDLDIANVAEKRTNSLVKYVQGGVEAMMLPFHYLTHVLGMSDAEARAIIQDAGTEDGLPELDTDLEPEPKPASRARSGE